MVCGITSGELQASLLSTITKIDAGQKISRNYQTPNILNMMLGGRTFC